MSAKPQPGWHNGYGLGTLENIGAPQRAVLTLIAALGAAALLVRKSRGR
jgi:hypothetical protein